MPHIVLVLNRKMLGRTLNTETAGQCLKLSLEFHSWKWKFLHTLSCHATSYTCLSFKHVSPHSKLTLS